jgi:hypothetical protein
MHQQRTKTPPFDEFRDYRQRAEFMSASHDVSPLILFLPPSPHLCFLACYPVRMLQAPSFVVMTVNYNMHSMPEKL